MHNLCEHDSLPNYVSYEQYMTQCAYNKLYHHTSVPTNTAAIAVQYMIMAFVNSKLLLLSCEILLHYTVEPQLYDFPGTAKKRRKI